MGTTFEKIPADEFASRHGWTTEAVVHRIQAGIYEGVKEGDTWFVLRDAPVDILREAPGFPHTPPPKPRLPWTTVPFPLRGVGAAFWGGVVLMVIPLFPGTGDVPLWLAGIGIPLATAPLVYEGLRTGTVRALYIGPTAFSERPVVFVVHLLSFIGYSLIGAWLVFL